MQQPHLQRTKLCDMKDEDLDPIYVKRREQLKGLVASIIRPKIVQGKSLNGKEFVSFLEQVCFHCFSYSTEIILPFIAICNSISKKLVCNFSVHHNFMDFLFFETSKESHDDMLEHSYLTGISLFVSHLVFFFTGN